MVDWALLRTFHAVAEHGSLSAAARGLRLSQPTVGRQVAALEAALGGRLFVRHPRGLGLTPLGESIRESVAQMDRAAIDVGRMVGASGTTLQGVVRVSATEGLGAHWLTPHLLAFRRRYPGIQIEVLLDNFSVDLSRREADVALRLFRPQQPDLVARRVAPLDLALYASRGYLARRGMPQGVADLAQHDTIGHAGRLADLPHAIWLNDASGSSGPAYRSNSLLAQLSAAKAGLGVAVLGCLIADAEADLVRVLPEVPVPGGDIWLVYHGDLRDTPRIRVVADFLAERLVSAKASTASGGAAQNTRNDVY